MFILFIRRYIKVSVMFLKLEDFYAKMNKKLFILMVLVSVFGLLDSAYLTYIHYYETDHKICELVGNFECDIVNKSIYAEVDGVLSMFGIHVNLPIPLSVLGGLFFLALLGIQTSLYLKKPFFGYSIEERKNMLFLLSILGMCFGLFLIYIQAIVLRAWCLFCLILDIILFSTLILSFIVKKSR
jgi:uncharacterized membrane protein